MTLCAHLLLLNFIFGCILTMDKWEFVVWDDDKNKENKIQPPPPPTNMLKGNGIVLWNTKQWFVRTHADAKLLT